MQRRFRDKVTIALESHVAQLQASIATIAHQERPDYLDRLAMLRDQVFVLDHMYVSLFSTIGWILRLGVTIALLVSIHPALALLAVFALPTVVTSTWRPAVERAAQERGAQANRLSRHLFTIATTPSPGKEVRVTGIGPRLIAERREAWERWYGPVSSARWGSALWHTLAWALFGAAYVGAVIFVAWGLAASASAVLLVLAAGSRLSAYIGATVGEIGFLRGFWMDGSRRLAWLEDYAASLSAKADLPAPDRLQRRHSPRSRVVRVSRHLASGPRGCVAATAGRSSYRNRRRKRRGQDDARKAAREDVRALIRRNLRGRDTACARFGRSSGARVWPAHFRISSASNFLRVKPSASATWFALDDEPALAAAVDRAGAQDVISHLRSGLDTQLGPTWPGGVDLSFGQWQKLALARGFMRERPLLLVLDEPTAALDAETEHALFERYAAAARNRAESATGGITLLVSHRFSTVRMADLIVVLDGAHVVEVGAHDELMAKRGQYAELYGIQAAAYR